MALNIGDMAYYNANDEELRRRLAEVVRRQKQAPPPPPMKRDDYDSGYDSHTFEPKRKTREEIKIEELTIENQKLKDQYSDLLKKANKLVAAYRELKTENDVLVSKNEALTQKKLKKEAVSQGFADVGKGFRTTWDKIILWFNT